MQTKQKIFIVDDDQDMIDFLSTCLESNDYKAQATSDARDAVEKILKIRPQGIIVDLMMPEKDGFELVRDLRQEKSLDSTKIIVISSKTYEFDRRRCADLGADGYITKPLNPQTITQQIRRILDDQIDMTFWGVRGTLPVPGEKTLKYGGNTSCISLEIPGENLLIFDAGSGIKALSDKMMEWNRYPVIGKIFISHPHWDHINALPFFGPMFNQGNEFEICGASHCDISMREMISAQMDGVYFPITLKEFAARVYFRNLAEEEIEIGEVKIATKLLNHPGKCLGYRVTYKDRSICYITDNELFNEDSDFYNPFYVKGLIKFIQGTDALVTDTTYSDEEYLSKVGWGHSSVSQVVKLAHKAEVKNLYLFHHDPDQTDDDIDEKFKAAQRLLLELKSNTQCIAPCEGDVVR
ncbi:MAG: response regulator, partial [Alphaproteobacteria bacterium]|nr:response regulator [Alphaproteobacteria bacterium]